MKASHGFLLGAVLAAACGGGDDDGADAGVALFPADYASTYVEVRDCRRSGDHQLNFVRVLADPAAAGPYLDRQDPFPEGAVVLKEERDPADESCAEAITRWTVMVKLAEGTSTETLDWRWQDLDADRNVVGEDVPLCYGCHSSCGVAPDGYDGTCAVP